MEANVNRKMQELSESLKSLTKEAAAKSYDKVCFTVNKQVKQDFDKLCADKYLIKSKVINALLREFIDKMQKGV